MATRNGSRRTLLAPVATYPPAHMQTHLRYKYPCAASRISFVFFLLKLALVTPRILILAAIMERRLVEARLRGLVQNFTDVFIQRSVVEVPQYVDAVLCCCRNFPLRVFIEFYHRMSEEYIE